MVESMLHKDMKASVKKHLVKDEYYRYEAVIGHTRAKYLRVDVKYIRNKRTYLVECETRPNMKRLKAKALLRKKIKYRTRYILVTTVSEYGKHDWSQLKGYFDQVYAYDQEKDCYTEMIDLRVLGWLQDYFLDWWMPIRRTTVRNLWWVFYSNKHGIQGSIRSRVQCSLCKLGLDSPWRICPRYDCPDSTYTYLDE